MFSVIFEVLPRQEKFSRYLELAGQLKPLLVEIDGFVDNERFESRRRPGWILSHSTWRDEKSVVRWRTTPEHNLIQRQGRDGILADYHLRVGDVTGDTAAPREAPIHEQRFDATEIGAAKCATLTEITPDPGATLSALPAFLSELAIDPSNEAIVDYDLFASIYNPGKLALLVSWSEPRAAAEWTPREPQGVQSLRQRKIRIVRDYGMFDRREAPQFHPDAEGRPTQHARARQ